MVQYNVLFLSISNTAFMGGTYLLNLTDDTHKKLLTCVW